MAMKNRNRVPVNSSYTGHGFMDRWPGRRAVLKARMSPHCSASVDDRKVED